MDYGVLGQWEESGQLCEVEYELAPDLQPGATIIVPLEKEENYGVPLGPGEYWMLSSGAGVFELDEVGSDSQITARRASPVAQLAPESVGISDLETLGSLLAAVADAKHTEKPLK